MRLRACDISECVIDDKPALSINFCTSKTDPSFKGSIVVSDIYPTKRKNVFTLCVVSYDLKGISVTTLCSNHIITNSIQ
jgi:hypothetical protein